MTRQLTVKQERFVQEYCANGGNGTQAAIAAGYSEKGADVQAVSLLRNIRIAAAIRAHRDETAERAHITVENQTLELEKDRQAARDNGQISAAIQATGLILKAHGLLTEDRKNARDPLTDAMARVAEREEKRRSVH